jgi:hypothetical protein
MAGEHMCSRQTAKQKRPPFGDLFCIPGGEQLLLVALLSALTGILSLLAGLLVRVLTLLSALTTLLVLLAALLVLLAVLVILVRHDVFPLLDQRMIKPSCEVAFQLMREAKTTGA